MFFSLVIFQGVVLAQETATEKPVVVEDEMAVATDDQGDVAWDETETTYEEDMPAPSDEAAPSQEVAKPSEPQEMN